MRLRNAVLAVVAVVLASAAVAVVVLTHDTWKAWLPAGPGATAPSGGEGHPHADEDHIEVSAQARASMGLEVARLRLTSHARSIAIPGEVVELPGHSDLVVTAPIAGVVQRVYHAPWQTIRPGERLFTLALQSESIQASQAALFRARRELETVTKQRDMLQASARTGAVSSARLLELELQEGRLEAAIQSHRFELAARGFSPSDVDRAAAGQFVSAIDIRAPDTTAHADEGEPRHPEAGDVFEIQEMKVNLGQQVQAGQALCLLTFHHRLAIEGHAFRAELPLVERAAREGTPVEADWSDGAPGGWPPHPEKLQVRTLANVVEERSQAVPFYVPVVNQFREFERDGKKYRVWRYRPGQRVRLSLPVEEVKGIFRLPRAAVVREGVEHFVFRQNGDVFERKPVRVLFEDRRFVVVANDGSVGEGHYVAMNNAAALNRALKTKAGEGDGHGHHHHH